MKKNIFGILIFILSHQSFGWGPIGHRTAGLIADANLTPKAKASVSYLLKNQGLADVANWADVIKSGTAYQQTLRYHYEGVPVGMNYLEYLQNTKADERDKGGTVLAMLVARDTLRSPSTNLQDKTDALKFLAHFVADIHQPLHTGRPGDRGGNDIKLNWFGEPSNLHRVWDSGMILTGHRNIINQNMTLEQSSLIYAQFLAKVSGRQIRFVRSDFDNWVYESLSLRDSAVYDQSYLNQQAAYQGKLLQYLDNRVLVSGLRLADTLNQIFEIQPIPPEEVTFRKEIEAIVGNLYRFISLRP